MPTFVNALVLIFGAVLIGFGFEMGRMLCRDAVELAGLMMQAASDWLRDRSPARR